VDPEKIEAMKDWPCHKNLKILCGFLVLTGYYRKFVLNYGKITTPLIVRLEKNAFSWTTTTNQSFHALKEAMCMIPVLALPYFTKICVLECDASGKGIGTVLMQDARPLDFTGKQLSECHLGQSTYEKEMMDIMHVVYLCHPCILGQCFQIKTDHCSLKYFLEQ
jgi:hypothetical protein